MFTEAWREKSTGLAQLVGFQLFKRFKIQGKVYYFWDIRRFIFIN